ncbi:MAG: response regulator [Thermoanaerobaculia bacterium]|nr:response regulator [Thermoanaerobaculia bacterium]
MDAKRSEEPLVLFADDDVDLHELMRAALRRLDWDLDCVTNGLDALAAFRKRRHDAIILDLMMPKLNGYEFLMDVKMIDPEAPERTVVLTGTGEDTWGLFDRSSVCAFLTKPIDLDELIPEVEECLRRSEAKTTA